MWVAIILACLDPSALSCKVIAKPELFYDKQKCMEETRIVASTLIEKGVYALPSCYEIGTTL
jgi:hypothetical protein